MKPIELTGLLMLTDTNAQQMRRFLDNLPITATQEEVQVIKSANVGISSASQRYIHQNRHQRRKQDSLVRRRKQHK